MKKILAVGLWILVIFVLILPKQAFGSTKEEIVSAKITQVNPVVYYEGLKTQMVTCELLEGEHKGAVFDVQILIGQEFTRQSKIGDKIKVSVVDRDGDLLVQFYDYSRMSSYIWLVLLFVLLLVLFIGLSGIKRLLPLLLIILLIFIGFLPDFLLRFGAYLVAFIAIAAISGFTGFIRIKDILLTAIVVASVLVSLGIGFILFAGFSSTIYVEPFLGSITTTNDQVYSDFLFIMKLGMLFIPLGSVLNSSIQITKFLLEKFGKAKKILLAPMLKSSYTVSQKIVAAEFNNLAIMIIGMSLAGMYLIRQEYPQVSVWENGWVALQILYIVSIGFVILLTTPITAFVTAIAMFLSPAYPVSSKQSLLGSQSRRVRTKPRK